MKHIAYYQEYEKIDEGLKNWASTLLLLASFGLVPLSVTAGDKKDKKEFVESQPQSKIDAALFVKYMTDNKLSDITSAYTQFIKLSGGKGKKNVVLLYHGIDYLKFKYRLRKFSKKDQVKVLTDARFVEKKGLGILSNAIVVIRPP